MPCTYYTHSTMKQRKKSASEKRTTYSVVVCVVRTAQNSDEESMVVSNDGPRSRRIGSPFQRQVCVRYKEGAT